MYMSNGIKNSYCHRRLIAHTMHPASFSIGAHTCSLDSTVRLKYTIGRTELSFCGCSRVAPKPAALASQYKRNFREPFRAASNSGYTSTGGFVSTLSTSRTTVSISASKENGTSFFSSLVIGCSLLDRFGKNFRIVT